MRIFGRRTGGWVPNIDQYDVAPGTVLRTVSLMSLGYIYDVLPRLRPDEVEILRGSVHESAPPSGEPPESTPIDDEVVLCSGVVENRGLRIGSRWNRGESTGCLSSATTGAAVKYTLERRGAWMLVISQGRRYNLPKEVYGIIRDAVTRAGRGVTEDLYLVTSVLVSPRWKFVQSDGDNVMTTVETPSSGASWPRILAESLGGSVSSSTVLKSLGHSGVAAFRAVRLTDFFDDVRGPRPPVPRPPTDQESRSLGHHASNSDSADLDHPQLETPHQTGDDASTTSPLCVSTPSAAAASLLAPSSSTECDPILEDAIRRVSIDTTPAIALDIIDRHPGTLPTIAQDIIDRHRGPLPSVAQDIIHRHRGLLPSVVLEAVAPFDGADPTTCPLSNSSSSSSSQNQGSSSQQPTFLEHA